MTWKDAQDYCQNKGGNLYTEVVKGTREGREAIYGSNADSTKDDEPLTDKKIDKDL